MIDRLTCGLYNFANFLVAIVKSFTAIAFVWYREARAQLLVPSLLGLSRLSYNTVHFIHMNSKGHLILESIDVETCAVLVIINGSEFTVLLENS